MATPAGWYSAFREATWEEALSLAAQEILRIRDQHGPRALGALSSAKCSNEDNYAFMRMVRGAFRTNSVDHCTRLCHSTSVSAMNRALNTAAASGSMREIEEATDVIFIAGANTTESHPVFGALIKRAVARGAKLIVADVRRVELAELADIHLQMLPGTDVALFNTMLHHIIDAGLTDPTFIAQRTREFEKVAAAVRPYTLQMGEKITGIPRETYPPGGGDVCPGPPHLHALGHGPHPARHRYRHRGKSAQSASGLRNDREVGCPDDADSGTEQRPGRQRRGAHPVCLYRLPAGFPACQPGGVRARRGECPRKSLSLEDGMMVTEMTRDDSPIRGLYIMGENPVISDPNIAHAEEWVRGLEFLAVQDLFLTETARWADVVLPGSSFAEKTGTYVNTERRIQLAQAALEPPGEARRDLDILIDLSNRLGLRTTWSGPEAVMEEIASVTPSWRGVTYEGLKGSGLQYPVLTRESKGTAFLFADAFPTGDGKGIFVPVEYVAPEELPDDEYPFIMNTGRQMYHWHTGTMTRRSTGLDSREPVPVVDINPRDALELGDCRGRHGPRDLPPRLHADRSPPLRASGSGTDLYSVPFQGSCRQPSHQPAAGSLRQDRRVQDQRGAGGAGDGVSGLNPPVLPALPALPIFLPHARPGQRVRRSRHCSPRCAGSHLWTD